jgi:hypothetical protein
MLGIGQRSLFQFLWHAIQNLNEQNAVRSSLLDAPYTLDVSHTGNTPECGNDSLELLFVAYFHSNIDDRTIVCSGLISTGLERSYIARFS